MNVGKSGGQVRDSNIIPFRGLATKNSPKGVYVSEERLELSISGLIGRDGAHVSHNQCPAVFIESVGFESTVLVDQSTLQDDVYQIFLLSQ